MLEKKRTTNQKLNGPKDETGIDEYDDNFLLGGDTFSQTKAREIEYQKRRDERKGAQTYEFQLKSEQYRQKEDQQMQSVLDKSNYLNRFK